MKNVKQMWRIITALVLTLALPASVSAGPLAAAAEKAGRELARAQEQQVTQRGRFWTGVALLAGGSAVALLGAFEVGDDEDGPDDAEDTDESDDGEDSDGWHKAALGGGIAAAALGGVLMMTGRDSNPAISVRKGRVTLRQTFRF